MDTRSIQYDTRSIQYDTSYGENGSASCAARVRVGQSVALCRGEGGLWGRLGGQVVTGQAQPHVLKAVCGGVLPRVRDIAAVVTLSVFV